MRPLDRVSKHLASKHPRLSFKAFMNSDDFKRIGKRNMETVGAKKLEPASTKDDFQPDIQTRMPPPINPLAPIKCESAWGLTPDRLRNLTPANTQDVPMNQRQVDP